MDKETDFITPGGTPVLPGNPPSSEAGPMDSGEGQTLLEKSEDLVEEREGSGTAKVLGEDRGCSSNWVQVNPFERRESCKRTPPLVRKFSERSGTDQGTPQRTRPKSPYSMKAGMSTIVTRDVELRGKESARSAARDGSVEQRKKRLREENSPRVVRREEPTPSPEVLDLREAILQIANQTRALEKAIREVPNTKNVIKDTFKALRRLVEVADAKRKEHQEFPISVDKVDIGTQAGAGGKLKTRSIGTQAREWVSERDFEELNRKLDAKVPIEELAGWWDVEWPEAVFTATVEETGSPLQIERTEDIVVIITDKGVEERGLVKSLKDKVPGLKKLVDGGLEEGKLEFLRWDTRTESSKGEEENSSRFIFLIPLPPGENANEDRARLHVALADLRERMEELGRERALLAAPDDVTAGPLRKILEFSLRRSAVEIKLLKRQDKRAVAGRNKPPDNKGERNWGGKSTEALSVRREGISYAELLKSIRDEIKVEELGVDIKQIRKGGGEEVRLLFKGDAEAANNLSGMISSKINGAVVKTERNKMSVMVQGMDEATTEEEIKGALVQRGIKEDEVMITSLRSGPRSKNATIEVPADKGRGLVRSGSLRVGWLVCRVRERVDIPRCYNCLDFGHKAVQCAKVSMAEKCLKCAQEGHRAKECTGREFCPECNVAGHRAGQTRCPAFRRLIEARKRRYGRN